MGELAHSPAFYWLKYAHLATHTSIWRKRRLRNRLSLKYPAKRDVTTNQDPLRICARDLRVSKNSTLRDFAGSMAEFVVGTVPNVIRRTLQRGQNHVAVGKPVEAHEVEVFLSAKNRDDVRLSDHG